METSVKKRLKKLVRPKRLTMPEPSINFKYPFLIIAFVYALLVFNSNEAEQKAPETKQTDTTKTFNEFVERVLRERRAGGETYFLGMVSEKMQKMLNDSVQMNFKGYKWRIGNDAILHINTKHGNFRKESSRGQINVAAKDYQKIYSIINVPDKISLSINAHSGEKFLELSKYINKQKYTYVVLISRKYRRLTGKTMYIKKAPVIKPMPFLKPLRATNAISLIRTSETLTFLISIQSYEIMNKKASSLIRNIKMQLTLEKNLARLK